MSNIVRLQPLEITKRVIRLATDAKHMAETMNGREAVSLCLIIEEARDNLSRVLERAKKELEP